ncbi:MAG: NAD(P)H-dependent oxidoreductase [Pseudomonadota bacterium]|nr:NAD(P)H-dependent oxidoreductase [Gammaproteobacteria bacterium]MBU1628952.1 NAD(P)H-dependent oxidoreductase [Gammaproteobacteria bacterium]MBU1926392.1 NAD(P)H-dependent oxidoreductase [Gammaproteobacteria bacterium]MBU2545933.1 NAD(P)H-dependent oxidoreductase [Gammaproteobacteria bacterium]
MKLLMMAASTRQDSLNEKLITVAADIAHQLQIEADHPAFSEFALPLYDGDLEAQEGVPHEALLFSERLNQADGLMLSSPEYNFSTPGTLKNLIDWVSRIPPLGSAWAKQCIFLMSASPAMAGGSRGLMHTQIPLTICGAYLFPQFFSLAKADKAFDEDNQLIDTRTHERLKKNLEDFVSFIQKRR